MPGKSLDRTLSEAASSALTRRSLLHKGGALVTLGVGSSFIAACGGSTATKSSSTASLATGTGEATGRIEFIGWQGYDAPKAMAAFKKKTGIVMKPTYMGNHDEIQAKVLATKGSKGLDMTMYAQAYAPLYKELNILEPIDEDRLPNLGNLFEFFGGDYNNFWVDADGTRRGVPFNWGYVAMSYDAGVIDQPATYDDLLDPKFKGKIGIPEDLIGVMQLAAHNEKVDITKMSEADFTKVKEFLTKMVRQTNGVSPTYGDLATRFSEGSIVAAFCGWAPIDGLAAEGGNKKVTTVLPDSGGVGYCDSLSIPPTCDNVDAVYAWMNETMNTKTAVAILEGIGTATPVETAVPLLPAALRDAYPYDDLNAFFEKAPMYALAPFKSDEYVTWPDCVDAWQKIKASA